MISLSIFRIDSYGTLTILQSFIKLFDFVIGKGSISIGLISLIVKFYAVGVIFYCLLIIFAFYGFVAFILLIFSELFIISFLRLLIEIAFYVKLLLIRLLLFVKYFMGKFRDRIALQRLFPFLQLFINLIPSL